MLNRPHAEPASRLLLFSFDSGPGELAGAREDAIRPLGSTTVSFSTAIRGGVGLEGSPGQGHASGDSVVLGIEAGDHPHDLLAVDYRCEVQGAGVLLELRFRTGDAEVAPASTFWRAHFIAPTPAGATEYGETFVVEAAADASDTPTFRFGRLAGGRPGIAATTAASRRPRRG